MSSRAGPDSIKRKELVGKLNATCLTAFSEAARNAKTRGNPYVELVHFVQSLVETKNSDLDLMLDGAGCDRGRLGADLVRALDALPRGAGSVEEFSDHIFRAIREAWNLGLLGYDDPAVRSAYLLIAMFETPVLEALLVRMSGEFEKLDTDVLRHDLSGLLERSVEGIGAPTAPEAGPAAKPTAPGRASALAQFATDVTEQARSGRLDPVLGRDPEIRQLIDVLLRRKQNNPILVGEAGVGKTAVVEGFAQRIVRGDVPPTLQGVVLQMLDIGLLQAGASVKGEFEKRLKAVIDEVRSSDQQIILFIDEAHTLIGAGGAAGTGDAANLLKPPLARGELRTVAATTWSEYKQFIEPDPALTRRFQPIRVEEPSPETAVLMCRGVAGVLEKHHAVEILDEAIEASVHLSHRYIPARQLPDKAISLLDTACARVAVSQHGTPAIVEDAERRVGALEVEQGIAEREEAIGIDVAERKAEIAARMETASAELAAARERWGAERALVSEILAIRARLRAGGQRLDPDETKVPAADPPASAQMMAETPNDAAIETFDSDAAITELKGKLADLARQQGDSPLILPSVDRAAVAAVVEDWTGIPTGRMLASEAERALGLAQHLSQRVTGQDHAMEMIASRLQTSAAGLGAEEKPIGVFLLCGPSGVGKTETALALAEAIYGGEGNLISINMSEYQEAHTVATLKGAPPGYVGYGKGGVLTEAVRRKPYSVILLDEVEKAHPDVHEIFFQVFDKGIMDDSEGRRIDFRHTLILLTSNVGTDEIMERTDGGRRPVDADALAAALRPPLLKVFPPALLGRLIPIPYYPLSERMIEVIAGLKLQKVAGRLAKAHGADLVMGDGALDLIKARCTEIESGGRMIDAILTNTLLPEMSRRILCWRLEGKVLREVTVTGSVNGFSYHFV